MKKQEATRIVKGFGRVDASQARRIAVAQANGWLTDILAAVICRDEAAIARRVAEYDKALEVALA